MARKANNPTLVMLVQEIKPKSWLHSSDPGFLALLENAHVANDLPKEDPSRVDALRVAASAVSEYVVSRWEGAGLEVEDAHAILHGDDTQSLWNPAISAPVEVPKFLHLHLLVKFRSRETSAAVGKLAELAGVEPQYLELDKSRGGAPVPVCGKKMTQQHDNGLAYLVHVKYPEKYQYPPEQVASVRGMDYAQVYLERYAVWFKGRAHIKVKHAQLEFEAFRERVLQGAVSRDQIMLTDELFDIYSRHQREIDDALAAYGQRRAYRAATKLRNGDFATQVVYVHGPAGVGKTNFAKRLIAAAIETADGHGHHWQVYRAATGNPLDDWQGEEVVLLDDLRASAMDANDWLLLLDPYNASPARARYRNKTEVAPRLIVITATIDPIEFFFYARKKGEVDEALDQFIRRLQSVVKVYREDDILRYRLQQIGPVDPYLKRIRKSDANRYFLDDEKYESFTLNYGSVAEIEHSMDGAVGGLLSGLSQRSPDLQLASGGAWSALIATANQEARTA